MSIVEDDDKDGSRREERKIYGEVWWEGREKEGVCYY